MAYTTIKKSTDYFRTKLYTGNETARSITFDESANMQPDLMWVKSRGHTASWLCNDVVRGATKRLKLDNTAAESTQTAMISAFNTNGFSLGTSTTANQNSTKFVAFNWKANGSSTTTPTGGTITTTVSANTTAGFSIFTYTGNGNAAHLAHGLGVAPDVVIIKGRTNTDAYFVKHKNLNANQYIYLNNTGAVTSGANVWSNTNPDATKIYVGTDGGVNGSGTTYVGYAFAEKTGYSKFGAYTGNGNADGPFIYTGFKPAFVIFKRTDNTGEWYVKDNKRSGTAALQDFGQMNPNMTQYIATSSTAVENKTSGYSMDILSNGFKARGTDSGINANNGSYIYLAFAEEPLVGDNPATAR